MLKGIAASAGVAVAKQTILLISFALSVVIISSNVDLKKLTKGKKK